MKLIRICNAGLDSDFAKVDDEDFEWLSKFNWHKSGKPNRPYAYRNVPQTVPMHFSSMHRLIMNPKRGEFVDHKNRDTLDNRKENLRVCTPSENSANQIIRDGFSSAFKGVCWCKRKRKWRATIVCEKIQTHIGYFKLEEDAAKAYNQAAIEKFGQFAALNKI